MVTALLKSGGFAYIGKHNFDFFNSWKQLLLMTAISGASIFKCIFATQHFCSPSMADDAVIHVAV